MHGVRLAKRCWCLVGLVLCAAACNPQFDYGNGVFVSCGVDADCLAGFVCLGEPARCVDVDAVDAVGVELTAPLNNALVTDGRVVFVWRGVPGAASYRVDVTIDAAGERPIAGSPFFVDGLQQTLVVEGLTESLTHYWSVRSDITLPEVPPQRRPFDNLGDVVYVYCPPERMSCLPEVAEVQAGNLSRPFTRVQDAIDAASRFERETIQVAARGDGLAYAENLRVSRGITLSGGFDPTFTTRDPMLHEVWIHEPVTALSISLTTTPTLVEDIHFSAGASDTAVVVGVTVDNVRAPVTFRHCSVAAGQGAELVTGVRVSSAVLAGTVRLEHVSVEADGSPSVRAVEARDAVVVVVDSRVVATSSTTLSNAVGISSEGALSELDVSATTVIAGAVEWATGIASQASSNTVKAVAIEVGPAPPVNPRFSNGIDFGVGVERAVIAGNRVSVRGRFLSRGVRLFQLNALVVNNLIGTFGCPAQQSQGIYLEQAQEQPSSFFAHNSFALTSGQAETYVFRINAGVASVIRNNVAVRLEACAGTGPEGLTSLSGGVDWTVTDNLVSSDLSLGVTSTGNTQLAQVGGEVFASLAGPDGDPQSLTDNDWRLATVLTAYVASAPNLVDDCTALLVDRFAGEDVCGFLATDAGGASRAGTVTPGAYEALP